MRDGAARVFMCMGGNFVRATPDTRVTEAAIANTRLTVKVSTKLNRSHAITGRRALILPTLGRTDRDTQAGGDPRVTVEDSMSMVHASRGRLEPPDGGLLSEVAIVCRLARRMFDGGRSPFGTAAPQADYGAAGSRLLTAQQLGKHAGPSPGPARAGKGPKPLTMFRSPA